MLFPYTYVPHKMEKMQEFIDFIFHEVWCNAPTSGPFGLHLFDTNAELREVMDAFHYSDGQGAYFFSSNIERIYDLFSPLTIGQINQFKQWYQGNNDLENVCDNNAGTQLVRYADIASYHKDLSVQLAVFFKSLYSQSLLNLAALQAKIGNVADHYQAFVSVNKVGKCPFCGVNDLLGVYHSKREAYDHYLPKSQYPFNSINFRNLVPACHLCNSSYKTSKDPAYIAKDPTAVPRRAIFYPYTPVTYNIELEVSLQHSDISKLQPVDVELTFGPIALTEKIDTWKEIYGIEERYKAKLCGEEDGKYWFTQVFDECQQFDKDPKDILAMRAKQTQRHPYADCNFLRTPFLNACQLIGVLD